MHTTNMKSYTFDPVVCEGFNASTKDHAMDMHTRYSNGIDPLYVVAITNHVGLPDDETEYAYNKILGMNILSFFGRWFDVENLEFVDVSYPINHGIKESKIM